MKIATDMCDALPILSDFLPEHEVECIDNVNDAEVLIFLHWNRVKSYISRMKNLRLLQALTAGVDHIPLTEIPKNAYLCSNAGANAWAVAEHAFSLTMAALKKIVYRDRKMRDGEFPQLIESRLLRGKKVILVGFGHIGKNIARMLEPFKVEIIAINRSGKYNGEIKISEIMPISEIDKALKMADIVILCLPLTSDTEGIINRRRLEIMKSDGILVNVSRGKIVVEEDLYEFLKERNEFVAALDVWWKYGAKFKQDYPFEKLDNVILSPHCGGVYENWVVDSFKHASENVRRLEKGEILKNVVKKPQE